MVRRLTEALLSDARHGQIIALSLLAAAGAAQFAFDIEPARVAAALGAALAVQAAGSRIAGIAFDWRSPVITALSLTLLLRADTAALVALAAALAIASKFAIRAGGRHLFNPAAFGIAAVTLLFPGAWVSPGQWGTEGWLLLLAAGLGTLVTGRARRAAVPLLFLAFWAALSFGRAAWLGDPMAIPVHRMQSGALIVFAFFMISDPMSQPWHPVARVVWIAAVAAIGFALQHEWVVDAGPLWGLVIAAPLVPLLDRLMPAKRARWRGPALPELSPATDVKKDAPA